MYIYIYIHTNISIYRHILGRHTQVHTPIHIHNEGLEVHEEINQFRKKNEQSKRKVE